MSACYMVFGGILLMMELIIVIQNAIIAHNQEIIFMQQKDGNKENQSIQENDWR